MPQKKKSKHRKPSQVHEPQASYGLEGEKSIRFFNSFEEMNAYDHKEMAKHTPMQRLENINYLIRHLYADTLEKPFTDFQLHFK